MRILLTNDDGIQSENLHRIHAALKRAGHGVFTAAPAEPQSGKSCGITVNKPLLTRKVVLPDAAGGPFEGLAIQGTPADCALLALEGGLCGRPDLVISGVNIGPNAGLDIFFSGTVGAALQAAMHGIPTLAVSHCARTPMTDAHAELTVKIASRMDWSALPLHRVYSLNIPDCPAERIHGVKICPHGTDYPRSIAYEKRTAPDGRGYYWMKDPFEYFERDTEGTDKYWLHRGWATLSPLKIDLNDYETLESQAFSTLLG